MFSSKIQNIYKKSWYLQEEAGIGKTLKVVGSINKKIIISKLFQYFKNSTVSAILPPKANVPNSNCLHTEDHLEIPLPLIPVTTLELS